MSTMTKIIVSIVTLMFIASLAAAASAGTSYGISDTSSEPIIGTVLFMSTNSLTVKDNKTRTYRTVDITIDKMSGLEEGDRVKIILQKNSNLAEKVIRIKSKAKKK